MSRLPPIHVAMVSEHASPLATLGAVDAGGQNVYVAALARELGRRGHRVSVFTRRDDPALPADVDMAPGVTVIHVDAGPAAHVAMDDMFPCMAEFREQLTAALSVDRPDLVHSHFWMSGWAAMRSCDDLALPLVHSYHALGVVKRRHQGAADASPPERDAIEQEIGARAQRVIATCAEELAELRGIGLRPTHLARIPCGYDDDVFTAFGAADGPPRRARYRAVAVSRLVPRKGLAEVIRAVAPLSDVELVVAGGPPRAALADDPDFRRLCAIALAEGIADRVTFLGGLDQAGVARLLRSADVFVAAPWYEPFGIAPVEAMACGTPVVGTAVGGLLDTVVDEQTGLLVPPRSVEHLSDAIRRLIVDQRLRKALGAAGARRAPRTYGWRVVGGAVERLYREVVGADAQVRVSG